MLDSLGLIMGLGGNDGIGQGNDYLSMMMFQQLMNGGGDLGDNKRLQMFLFAPIGKKFLSRIAQKIQQKSAAEGIKMARSVAELHAANIIRDLEEEQEGDLRQILKMARMSVRMNLLNSSGIEVNSATRGTGGETLGIGGYVTGRLSDEITPTEEIEEIVGEKKVAKKAVKPTIKKQAWE